MSSPRRAKASALAVLAPGYWLWRRRINRAIRSDPETSHLQGQLDLASTPLHVTSADGTRLHAEVFGPATAPTIVLVHGWCASISFWHYQLRDLSADYRIVAYDLRGHGRSDRPGPAGSSTDALAADLDAVLQTTVPPGEQVVLAGHSMGGMSIVAWAGAHADDVAARVAGVVLVDTGMGGLIAGSRLLPKVSALAGVQTAVGRIALGLPVPLARPPDPIAYHGIRMIALSRTARPAHVAFCTRMVASCPPRVRAAFGLTLARLELTDCLPKLTVPTAVVVGADDVLTPLEQSERIAADVPGATLFALPDTGHMAPVEGHAAVTGHIRTMAERTLAPPRA